MVLLDGGMDGMWSYGRMSYHPDGKEEDEHLSRVDYYIICLNGKEPTRIAAAVPAEATDTITSQIVVCMHAHYNINHDIFKSLLALATHIVCQESIRSESRLLHHHTL
ncbi:hypothetical protein TNIN_120431 [Trichonephila inaurata madagascariensis]|uniref:Uncharacterized protein n=1 Tax=Trichonephila inaurata madagascariensis TaxID=2747483 RepID=A0A8X6II19_9ARAC|nr:hypothetical protein TNIN_120431 [Trichonephila inaurata madagascariensis]